MSILLLNKKIFKYKINGRIKYQICNVLCINIKAIFNIICHLHLMT